MPLLRSRACDPATARSAADLARVSHDAALAGRKWQHWLDLSAPHVAPRWALSALVVLIYCLRVYLINGWYIITYGLGIYVLNLLIGFLSPQSDPESEGPVRTRACGDGGARGARATRMHLWPPGWRCCRGVCL